MKILVTGANGYLIRNLKTCLNDHEMRFVVRKKNSDKQKNSLEVIADIRDSNRLKQIFDEFKPDIILHAAARVLIENCNSEDHEMYETNITGTKNLMKLAPSGSTVIFISSMTVYSEENHLPVTENGLCVPPHFYGFTKLIGEEIVRYYGTCRDVNYLILRLPGLFGGDRKAGYIYSTILKALNNEDIILKTDSLIYWQTISVDDVDKIIGLLINKIQSVSLNETFNICYNEDTDFINTARYIVRETGSNSKIFIEEPVGYKKFPLSGQKLIDKLEISPLNTYNESLKNFIKDVKESLCGL